MSAGFVDFTGSGFFKTAGRFSALRIQSGHSARASYKNRLSVKFAVFDE